MAVRLSVALGQEKAKGVRLSDITAEPQAGDIITGEPVPEPQKITGARLSDITGPPPIEPRRFTGFFNELGRGLIRETGRVTASGLSAVERAAQSSIFRPGFFSEKAEFINERITSAPQFAAGREGGVKGFVANALGSALPFTAGTVGATLLTGSPLAAFGVAFVVEGEEARNNALAAGASEEQADLEAFIVGTINGALEQLQVDEILKFAGVGKGSIRTIVQAAKAKSLKKIGAEVGKLTVQGVKTSIKEGTQEALQEASTQLVPGILGREFPDIADFVEREALAAAGGAIAGPILGGGVSIAQAIPSRTQVEDKTQFSQAAKEQVRQRVREATELQETQQAELDRQVTEIQRQAIAEGQAAEPGAEAAIIPPRAAEAVTVDKIAEKGRKVDLIVEEGKTAQKLEAETTKALTDRRFEIKDIPPTKRTPAQIAELNNIEDELVEKSDISIDLSDKTRLSQIKNTTDTIQQSGVYQLELDVLEDVPQLSGQFHVDSQEMPDIVQRFEGRPEILKKFVLAETGGLRWDQAAKDIGITDFDDFLDAVELFVDTQGQIKGGINIGALTRAVASGDPQISFLALKHDMLKAGFGADEINAELNELAEREQIDKNLIVPLLVPFERITDVQKKQAVLRELDKAQRPAKKKAAAPKTRAIEKARTKTQKTGSPTFVRQSGDRFIITTTPPAKGAFIKVTPPEPGQTTGKTEELFAGPTEAEAKEMDVLRQKVNIVASLRGISKKKLQELSKEHTGFKDITSTKAKNTIKPEQLRSLLNNVRRLRPKRIGHRTVITPKTENQIVSLKESLTKADLMTEPEFEKILAKETAGKLPKFIDSEAFITQPQGRAVINRMHDVAEKIRATESLNKAIEQDPEIAIEFEKLVPTEHVIGAKSPARLLSMRFFEQRQAERTDEPIYHVYQDLIFTHQARLRERRKLLNSLKEMEGFTKIAKSPEAMQRVSDWISSQSTLIDRPESPKGITRQEKDLANRISEIFKLYEFQARIGKFFEHKENLSDMPQYLRHKEAIDRALEIYNFEGIDPLFDYLRTQPWGIVRSGYEPMESVIRRVSTHKMPDIAIGKSHIKVRGITYAKQDRNILARLDSYMRQMDFIAFLQPKIKALVRTTEDVLDMFNKPRIVSSALSTFLDNLKRTNNEDGLVESVFRKVYSQAITTLVLGDISKPVRNSLQNIAFSEDRRDFVKLLKKLKPGESLLTAEETEYLETFVHQDRVMLSDWAFVGEEPFDLPLIGQFRFGINRLTKWVQRRTLYPGSDRLNRTMSFAAKIDRVKTAFTKKQSLAAKMKQARFSDMQKQEQQLALGILARDGVNAMARYVAKVHTDNTHFLYAREQRSPAEQTKVGRLVLNLALFKRAALEKAVLQIQKVVESNASFANRRRAAFVFVNLIAWSTLVNLLWKKLTGKRFGAYDFINFLEIDSGGLQLGAVRAIENIYNNMLRAGRGDTKALAALTIAIPKAADMFIPFYDHGLRAIEATLGTDNIDRVAFRKLRELIDSEYKSRGFEKVDRNLVENLQFVIAKGKLPPGARREKKTFK